MVPLSLVSGLLLVHIMLAWAEPFGRSYAARLAFINLTAMTYFAAAYALATAYRRQVQLHARLMGSTAILVLPPALASALLPFGPGFDPAFHKAYVICELVVVALIADDSRRGGSARRIRRCRCSAYCSRSVFWSSRRWRGGRDC